MVFTLRFAEPGGVTVPAEPDPQAPDGRERVHLLLDTDQEGRPHLPGTSLAGALREMVRDTRGPQTADTLFGRPPETRGGAEADAKASQIWVLGSRLLGLDGEDSAALASEFRTSTKISRCRGAAEDNTLRAEEMLPAGSRFEVFLRWDNAPAGAVEEFAERLAAWRPFLGRGVSRGRGRCAVEAVRHGTLRLDEPDDLLRWLTASGPELVRAVAINEVQAETSGGEPEPVLSAAISIAGPWRIGSGAAPDDQVIPILRAGGRPILPGTGMKGLLRSRAEFILRSVGVEPSPCLDQQCGPCWTCEVFGFGGRRDAASAAVGARAVIRIADVVIEDPVEICRTHIAIDRFTGGVLSGALYTREALEGGSFTLQVEQLTREVAPDKRSEIRAVLRLVLEDLDDGIIGMGGSVARGYGSVRVDLIGAEASGGLPSGPDARRELARMVRDREHVSG
jgi:CRISPR/Cas system CSM-associated protein Csm3 (group 7 of RAMP superfamily)